MSNNETIHKLTFPQKLWKLVNDDSNKILKWSNDGTAIFINFTLLENCISHPNNIFNVSKRLSFLRQLSHHNFQKNCRINQHGVDDSIFEYSNVYFQRDREDLLDKIESKKRGTGSLNCSRTLKKKNLTKKISRLTWARQNLRLTLAMQHLTRNKEFYVEIEKMRQSQVVKNSIAMFYDNPSDTVREFLETGMQLGYVDENSSSTLAKFYENFNTEMSVKNLKENICGTG